MINFKTRRGMRGLALSSFTGVAMAAGMLVAPGIAHADTKASHFVWTATSSNISTNGTLINNLATNDEPGALLFVTPNFDPGGVNGVYDNSPIGVYYDASASEWSIFNENVAAMPVDASFNVFVEPAATADAFTVTASASNIAGDTALIDSSATNDAPDAVLQATQVYNGAYNDNVAGVYYDGSEWGVFNEGDVAMATGTEYNVLVGPAEGGKTATLKGTRTNIAAAGGSAVSLGANATTAGDSNAFILDTPIWDPKGSCGCKYDTSQTGVSYFPSQWNVFNQSEGTVTPKTDFNLLYWNS
jgi:hypothetical protein